MNFIQNYHNSISVPYLNTCFSCLNCGEFAGIMKTWQVGNPKFSDGKGNWQKILFLIPKIKFHVIFVVKLYRAIFSQCYLETYVQHPIFMHCVGLNDTTLSVFTVFWVDKLIYPLVTALSLSMKNRWDLCVVC